MLLAENEKSFLSSLQTMYSTTLSHLLQPNTTKEQRDRLMVKTQKAHLRRAGPTEVAALHQQLAAAEEEILRLEQGILEKRLESELEALEKRAKGELEIVERLRRRMKEEQSSSSEEEESEPETEYHLPLEQPLISPQPTALSPDEETFIAAISRPTSPEKLAQKSPRASLPSLITNNKSQTPPQRPLFSPKLPPEFMTLPQLITTSPSPTSPGYSPLPGRYRRATFGSPLSTSVSMSVLDTAASANRNSLPTSPCAMSPLEITPTQKVEKAETNLFAGDVAPAVVELEQDEEKKDNQKAEKETVGKDKKTGDDQEKRTDKNEKKEADPESEKVTDEKDDKKDNHETGEEKDKEKDGKDKMKKDKHEDMRPGSPVLCTRVNGVEMTMI